MSRQWNGDRIRDDYEIALLRAFVDEGKPVLGLCRGAQVINVAMGGTLYQDIPTQRPDALRHRMQSLYEKNCHATSIVPGSGLARLYPGASAREDQLGASPGGEGPRPRARRRGVVGAGPRSSRRFAGPGPSYLFGVQWHPEFHPPGDRTFIDDTPLLDDFLATAARHKSAAYAV